MLRRLIISLAQLQAGNNLENFNCAKKSPKKTFNNFIHAT